MSLVHSSDVFCVLESAPVEDGVHMLVEFWKRGRADVGERMIDGIARHNRLLGRNNNSGAYTRMRKPPAVDQAKRSTPLPIISLLAQEGALFNIFKTVFDIENTEAEINKIAEVFYDQESIRFLTGKDVISRAASKAKNKASKKLLVDQMLSQKVYVENNFDIIFDALGIKCKEGALTKDNKVRAVRWMYSICGKGF